MCKLSTTPTNRGDQTAKKTALRKRHKLLIGRDAFIPDKNVEGGPAPTYLSTFMTVGVVVLALAISEQCFFHLISMMENYHPIFQDERNVKILARHLGVDTMGCIMVCYTAFQNIHIFQPLLSQFFLSLSKSKSPSSSNSKKENGTINHMPESAFESRLFTYHPAGQQLGLLFFSYQTKNMYDTIIWNDGPEFILHHTLAMLAAWSSMYPGCAQFYGIFYLGISELSTGVLCVLANFDEVHGVKGLEDVFPVGRVVVGVLFVVLFVACRAVIWPFTTYYFGRDVLNALRVDKEEYRRCRVWLKMLLVSCTGLSLLQVLWLGMIFYIMHEEVGKMMS